MSATVFVGWSSTDGKSRSEKALRSGVVDRPLDRRRAGDSVAIDSTSGQFKYGWLGSSRRDPQTAVQRGSVSRTDPAAVKTEAWTEDRIRDVPARSLTASDSDGDVVSCASGQCGVEEPLGDIRRMHARRRTQYQLGIADEAEEPVARNHDCAPRGSRTVSTPMAAGSLSGERKSVGVPRRFALRRVATKHAVSPIVVVANESSRITATVSAVRLVPRGGGRNGTVAATASIAVTVRRRTINWAVSPVGAVAASAIAAIAAQAASKP